MKFSPTKIINLIVVIIVLFLNYSCSKDSDLLADYVVDENAGTPGNIVNLENGTIITYEDKMVAINILKDIQSGVIRQGTVLKKVTPPKNGTTEIKTDSTIVYTPNKDFTGKDDVVYTVEETSPDNTTVEKENTVTVAVNPTLETKNDQAQTTADKNLVIPVLNNDTYSDKNTATVTQTTAPAKGTIVINNDNTLTYTPNADASGSDTFTYTAKVENTEKTASTEAEGTVIVDIAKNQNKGDITMGELLAFPGAVGHGRFTSGGRGGSVYEVTNLNDSGPGSFRDAVSKGNRTVVFKVGGIIRIKSRLYFGGDNITVAGQTAPGEGIAIYGSMTDTNQHENIIVRYVNFLVGDNGVKGDDDAFRVRKTTPGTASNFIFDHCGFFWGKDEVFSCEASSDESSSIKNVTIQRSIIGESFYSKGMILWRQNYNISVIANLFSNNGQRNIRASTRHSTFEMINNVIFGYDWATNPSYNNEFDVVGNVYQSSSTNNIVNLEPISVANSPQGSITLTKAYISDNTLNGGKGSISSKLTPYLQGSRQVSSGYTPISSSLVKKDVLNDVGANINGNNKLAQSQINDVYNNSMSLIKSESESVGISLSGGKAYPDSDKDGIDDEWETANGLNPKNISDGKELANNGNGYTNLEVFLHYLTIN
ncbi:cadherin-like domain-containing protein [Flavobacteriaceae bacterium F89]|uniref:Cadherin-like domain-containing protein n=1 Tax=Cerina litoralis TaxID=2874477 RepID=A0AAE3JTY0_9FLAO|nr:Ig-like domain-containing protein [Cerina litoralis]MCG2461897.1 cadherin-like domain-containing protein [Cerina litoralis]